MGSPLVFTSHIKIASDEQLGSTNNVSLLDQLIFQDIDIKANLTYVYFSYTMSLNGNSGILVVIKYMSVLISYFYREK